MVLSISQIALIALMMAGYARSHSWIACSDYAEKNGADWEPKKCRGFPREGYRYAQKDSFGQDRGFDFRPEETGKACKTKYGGASYNSQYPKAVYYRGQQVILAHPMKNHGADAACTNKYIPDHANKIYRGLVGKDTDRNLDYYRQFLVADLGVSRFGNSYTQSSKYPKPGYQNAPNFCKNTDRAMGTYSFDVPADLAAGDYTFVWRWSFNSENDMYSTCFDVEVVDTKAQRDLRLQGLGFTDFSVACGGTLSNNAAGSSVGCNGVTPPPTTTTTTTTTKLTTRSTTPGTTSPTTTGPNGSKMVPMGVFQMTGDVSLGFPGNGITRRFAFVHFDCDAQANFWFARVLSSDNGHYELLQENPVHVASGKIYYTVTFPLGCPVTSQPHAMLRKDE